MIGFTPAEFNQVREAIATAHLYCKVITPLLKARHTMMDKDQRNLTQYTPQVVAEGFNTIARITHRENRDPDALDTRPATKLTDIDTEAMREELENVSTLVLPDLVYQMVCALSELPMFHMIITKEPLTTHRAAILMAWAFEGGRRYGLQQALAILDTTTTEFKTGTEALLITALDGTLELPAPQLPFTSRSESPDGAAQSTGIDGSSQHTRSEVIPFAYPSIDDLDRAAEEQATAIAINPDINNHIHKVN
jgi:hypothetical protein